MTNATIVYFYAVFLTYPSIKTLQFNVHLGLHGDKAVSIFKLCYSIILDRKY